MMTDRTQHSDQLLNSPPPSDNYTRKSVLIALKANLKHPDARPAARTALLRVGAPEYRHQTYSYCHGTEIKPPYRFRL